VGAETRSHEAVPAFLHVAKHMNRRQPDLPPSKRVDRREGLLIVMYGDDLPVRSRGASDLRGRSVVIVRHVFVRCMDGRS